MKYILLLTLVLCQSAWSQEPFDLSAANPFKDKTHFTVSDGESVSLQFNNFNPFLYKITVTSTQQDYNLTMPQPFTNYFVVINPSSPIEKKEVSNGALWTLYENIKTNIDSYNKFVELYNKIQIKVHQDLKFIDIKANTISIMINAGVDSANVYEKSNEAIENIKSSYNDFKKEFVKTGGDANSEAGRLKTLVDGDIAALTTAKYEELPFDLYRLVSRINEKSFTFVSDLLTPSKDQITYVVKIDVIDDSATKKYGSGFRNNISHTFNIEVLNGFKIDFSAGLFITNLIDHKFVSLADSINGGTDSVKTGFKLVRNNEGLYKFGLASMGHVYWRWWKNINIGFNMGVGILQDQSVTYMVGGSLMFGRQQRFILNGGYTFGYVSRKADFVEENKFYIQIPGSPNVTNKRVSDGWYAGISYNLTK